MDEEELRRKVADLRLSKDVLADYASDDEMECIQRCEDTYPSGSPELYWCRINCLERSKIHGIATERGVL